MRQSVNQTTDIVKVIPPCATESSQGEGRKKNRGQAECVRGMGGHKKLGNGNIDVCPSRGWLGMVLGDGADSICGRVNSVEPWSRSLRVCYIKRKTRPERPEI
jgi:hypothetical protein